MFARVSWLKRAACSITRIRETLSNSFSNFYPLAKTLHPQHMHSCKLTLHVLVRAVRLTCNKTFLIFDSITECLNIIEEQCQALQSYLPEESTSQAIPLKLQPPVACQDRLTGEQLIDLQSRQSKSF